MEIIDNRLFIKNNTIMKKKFFLGLFLCSIFLMLTSCSEYHQRTGSLYIVKSFTKNQDNHYKIRMTDNTLIEADLSSRHSVSENLEVGDCIAYNENLFGRTFRILAKDFAENEKPGVVKDIFANEKGETFYTISDYPPIAFSDNQIQMGDYVRISAKNKITILEQPPVRKRSFIIMAVITGLFGLAFIFYLFYDRSRLCRSEEDVVNRYTILLFICCVICGWILYRI